MASSRAYSRSRRSPRLPVFIQRRAERLEQFAIDRIAVGQIAVGNVFGMPLHAERKVWRAVDADGLDRVVFRHALDDDALARFEDALAVQRIDADFFRIE